MVMAVAVVTTVGQEGPGFWWMEDSILILKNEEGNDIHPTGEKASGRTLDASMWCHHPRTESAGPGWSTGVGVWWCHQSSLIGAGDVARWKSTWPTGGGLHGPCTSHAERCELTKKGRWRKKSEAVSSPLSSTKKMQSEMRTTLPVAGTAPLLPPLHLVTLVKRSSMTTFAHEVIDLKLSIDLSPSGRIKEATAEQSHVAAGVQPPKSRPNLAWWRGTGWRPLVEPVSGPGVMRGGKGGVFMEQGVAVVSRVEWSLMLLCFNSLKAKTKTENTVTLGFHHGSNLPGWPVSQLKTWLGTSPQAQDVFPLFDLAICYPHRAGLQVWRHRLITSLLRMLQAANEKLHPQKTPDQKAIICSLSPSASRPTTLKKDRREKESKKDRKRDVVLHWHKLPRKLPGNLPGS